MTDLNPAQYKAVHHRGGPLLVLAGAGTGKTRVITHRFNELVKNGVEPDRILALTFTNKAAREMRSRLQQMGVRGISWVGTFHGICLEILRDRCHIVEYESGFSIYDDSDQRMLLKSILDRFPPIEDLDAKKAQGYISYAKDRGFTSDELGEQTRVPLPHLSRMKEVMREYTRRLRVANAMDFADLLIFTCEVLLDDAALKLTKHFEHILVDEFQDTNRVQMYLLDLLGGSAEMCVVGDDDQSIYTWRGAEARNMGDFLERNGVEIVKLEENYRSTEAIVACANSLISTNTERIAKTLNTSKQGAKVKVWEWATDREEASFVASLLSPPWGDHVILYRNHWLSRIFEAALRHRGIPYVMAGGVRFYDRAEIKDLLAYMKLTLNPSSEVDLLRIINKPARGIGSKTVSVLKQAATEQGCSLYEAVKASDKSKVQAFVSLVEALTKSASGLLQDFYPVLLSLSEYEEMYKKAAEAECSTQQERDKREEVRGRLANIYELASDIRQFIEDQPGATLATYIDHVMLVSAADTESGPKVVLSTIHAAKGLEFPHVHLVAWEENLLPGARAVEAAEKAGNNIPIEEERRLAYVGITRAKETLQITFARRRMVFGSLKEAIPSRFLHELDPSAIES